jgi:hypothetical protein
MPTQTYEPIATFTVTTPLSAVVFGSPSPLPTTYADLVLVVHGALTGSAVKYIYFNGVTTNQSCNTLTGDAGGGTTNAVYSSCYLDVVNSSTNTFTNVVNVFQYNNTNMEKSYLSKGNSAATAVEWISGRWASTAAITSIGVTTSSNNFATGTVFSLYGIASA